MDVISPTQFDREYELPDWRYILETIEATGAEGVAEWREADLENKMASSLEWIVPLPGDYIGSLDEEPLAEMKSLSERFVGCLDREGLTL